jgi:malonate transporter and related proteins
MLAVFATTFPFFALVLAGFVAARRGWLPLQAIGGLNGFVLYFALPCMLFRFGSTTPIAQLLDGALVLVYLPCGLLLLALSLCMSRSQGLRWDDSAFGALVTAFPNTGFMGVPLLVALLGKAAAGPAILTIVLDMIVTTSLCVGLSRLDDAGAASANADVTKPSGLANARRAALQALKGAAVNPMPWAIASGALVSGLGAAPLLQSHALAPLWQTMGLLADSASPVALFTIGAVLARSSMASTSSTSHHASRGLKDRGVWLSALLKLALHPLLVWGAALVVSRGGVRLDPFAVKVLVLVAALPSASNVVILAERFNANSERVAHIVLVSTSLAFVSFAVLTACLAQ